VRLFHYHLVTSKVRHVEARYLGKLGFGLVARHGGRRTFVATNGGYRLELHPPRDWIDELLANDDELRIGELHLRADDPAQKAEALCEALELEADGTAVAVGESIVRFVPGGPTGRPELASELFL
jgi:hypothetical protein